jgi:hypothetical protein
VIRAAALLALLALPAAAAERDRTLAVGLTELTYTTPVKALKRANAAADYETYDFAYIDRKFMTAVFGLSPKFPTGATGTRKPKPVKVGAYPADDIAFKRDGAYFRETLVDFGDEAFPGRVHFYYHGLTKEQKARADAIIASTRRLSN